MKPSLFLIPFNVHLDDVCDYAQQTIRILAKKNAVLGIALGNPISLWREPLAVLRGTWRLRQWGTTIIRPVMIIPGQRLEWVKRLNFFLLIMALNVWLLSQRREKVLWFFEPDFLSVFLNWLRVDTSIYDCVDYFPAYPRQRKEHRRCLRAAEIVVVNSHALERKFYSLRSDVVRVPLGFLPPTHFSFHQRKIPLTFGFLGAVSYRLDFQFLERLLRARPHDRVVFVGPQTFDRDTRAGKQQYHQFQKLLAHPRVQWQPAVLRHKLSKVLQQFDVGLIPYDVRDPFNRFSFPMKTMDYLYAGLPIVSTAIEELRYFSEYAYFPQEKGWKGLETFLHQHILSQQKKERSLALSHRWEKKITAIVAHLTDRTRSRNNHQ